MPDLDRRILDLVRRLDTGADDPGVPLRYLTDHGLFGHWTEAQAAVERLASHGYVRIVSEARGERAPTKRVKLKETMTDKERQRWREFRDAVEQMRQAQRLYFRTRSSDDLQRSKECERRVDDLLATVETPSLFEGVDLDC